MNTQPRILAQEVSYTYEEAETPALQKVSAAIAPGEFVAVLGHNGSGKSTFAKLLNALYIPTEGRLLGWIPGRRTRSGTCASTRA